MKITLKFDPTDDTEKNNMMENIEKVINSIIYRFSPPDYFYSYSAPYLQIPYSYVIDLYLIRNPV